MMEVIKDYQYYLEQLNELDEFTEELDLLEKSIVSQEDWQKFIDEVLAG